MSLCLPTSHMQTWQLGVAPALLLQIVRAEIALWTTGFVLMTLLINAPLLGPLLNLLGLTTATQEQLAARRQASGDAVGEKLG